MVRVILGLISALLFNLTLNYWVILLNLPPLFYRSFIKDRKTVLVSRLCCISYLLCVQIFVEHGKIYERRTCGLGVELSVGPADALRE